MALAVLLCVSTFLTCYWQGSAGCTTAPDRTRSGLLPRSLSSFTLSSRSTTQAPAEYLGAPTFTFRVPDAATVSRQGQRADPTIRQDDRAEGVVQMPFRSTHIRTTRNCHLK
jgi:hypothetical protein